MTKHESIPNCPLCAGGAAELFCRGKTREFFRCPQCDLVFVPPEFHLSPEEERARYEFHQQSLSDAGYRAFLNRLFEPLARKLSPGAHGLDFGCGREPTLSVLFEEAGFPCADYDLYFADDPSVLETQYDFLACSETIEHFRRPRDEFERLLRLVKPGGWIGIMTQLRDPVPEFDTWFYSRDPAHIGFYSRATFEFLAAAFGLKAEFHPGPAILLRRGTDSPAKTA